MRLLRASWFVCRGCFTCVGTIVLWSLWLLLSVLLVFQIRVALSRELAAPQILLRKLEHRLAAQGLRATFGRVRVDPTGGVDLTDFTLSTDLFKEPLFDAEVVRFRVNPWALFVGDVAVDQLHLSGARLHLPAMLSPSGRREPVLRDLEATLAIEGKQVRLDRLTARFGSLDVSAHGRIAMPARRRSTSRPQLLSQAVERYLAISRRLASFVPELAAFDRPMLTVELEPDAEKLAVADIGFRSHGARIPASRLKLGSSEEMLELGPSSVHLRQPLVEPAGRTFRIGGNSATIGFSSFAARDVVFAVDAALPVEGGFSVDRVELAVGSASGPRGIEGRDIAATLRPAGRRLEVDVLARTFEKPWEFSVAADFEAKTADVHVRGDVTPAMVEFVSAQTKHDLSIWFQPAQPVPIDAELRLGAGWKFQSTRGSLACGPVLVRKVPLEFARGEFSYEGDSLLFDRVVVKGGDNAVRGSYWMDTRTLDYRFLLTGTLQPPAISGWFGEWWARFWANFDFSAAAPAADVDVRGRWRVPSLSAVYVHADTSYPQIRGVALDHVRTTLFIRPDFYDSLELLATRGAGMARGTFTRSVDLAAGTLRRMDFSVTSDLDLTDSGRIFGKAGIDLVAPFAFEHPPKLVLNGRLDGPASGIGEHQSADIVLSSSGAFGFHGFPLRDMSTRATLRDDDLRLDELNMIFAGGRASGRARLSGMDKERRLGFDMAIENASLGQAIGTLEKFGAQRKGEAPPPQSKFQQRMADGRLSLRLSADGRYDDLFSFRGTGSADIGGAELAEINLLGALSKVLNFTSLRLDSANANFKLEGNGLVFSELRISGPTAAIDAHGVYRLDARDMDFRARVYPFEESRNLFASAIDFVLTPLSNVLQLKLSGSLDRPDWRFTYGPTSLLRSLAGEKDSAARPETGTPAPRPPPLLRR